MHVFIQARKYTSYNALRNCNCLYRNCKGRKCPGSLSSKWTLIFLCIVSHFTFFKPFGNEFKLVKRAAEGSYMVQNLLCDGVENLKKETGVPNEAL